jgi:hypothetical protein
VDEYQDVPVDDGRALLTVMEAASILRIGRTTAYALAREFLRTNGASGLPVVRVGKLPDSEVAAQRSTTAVRRRRNLLGLVVCYLEAAALTGR